MTMDTTPDLPRVATGVPGLDEILGGGLLKSGVYILQGMPGAGKTILANQVAHHHAAAGARVVYVTMLAESHARLLQHLHAFGFFDPDAVPERIYYISAFNALREHGLQGVVDLLRGEMRAHGATILVLDGLVMAASAAASEEALKVFISDIQAHSALAGCTTLLLTSDDPDRPVSAEQTMVDGIVLLREKAYGPRRERNIEVVKFRGSATLRGNHSFQIRDSGIVVLPRIEAARRQGSQGGVTSRPLSTGIKGLDAMFEIGGYGVGSANVVCGPSGCGKTTLAMHYAAAAPKGEKVVWFSFYESPEFVAEIAKRVGIDREGKLSGPDVHFCWHPYGENILDELAADLLDTVHRLKPARVVIDGMGGFHSTATFAERGGPFVTTLMNELRRSGSTTLITVEESQPGGPSAMDTATMSALADTIINWQMHHVNEVHRSLWIRKCRVSRADTAVRPVALRDNGLEVLQGPAIGG
jgi:circadian clock protein KaiC